MEWPTIDINGSLQRFNEWFDSFILEAIKPLSILSMGLGTVAVFNLQGLAIDPRFVISWAIVQALSMDGLFFATWDKLFSVKLQWRNALAIIGLGFIGLTLAIVAIAINAILGFQVLWGIADSQAAMSRIGISSELFTIVRAILAVAVFVMVSFVRSRARATAALQMALAETVLPPVGEGGVYSITNKVTNEAYIGSSVNLRSRWSTHRGLLIQGVHHCFRLQDAYNEYGSDVFEYTVLETLQDDCSVSFLRSREQFYIDAMKPAYNVGVVVGRNSQKKKVTVTPEQETMLAIPTAIERIDDSPDGVAFVATGSPGHREKIKATWLQFTQEGRAIKLTDIAEEAGVGYSTVKKWAGEIRREIEQSTGGQ